MTIRYVLIVILIAMVAILGAIALNGIFEAWETGQIEDPGKVRSASGLRRAGQQLTHNTGPLSGAILLAADTPVRKSIGSEACPSEG